MTELDNGATASTEEQRKQARRARWSKVAVGLVAVAGGIRACSALIGPAHAQDCDSSEVHSTLTELVNGVLKKNGSAATVSTLDQFRTTADDDQLRRCTAHIVMSDQSNGTITYHIDPKQVMIDNMQ